MSAPELWTVLRDDDGDCALVVPEGTDPTDALLTLLEEEYGGDRFALDNPAIVAAAEGLKVERWRSYSAALAEAEGIGEEDAYHGWWGPSGDGDEPIYVLVYDGNVYSLGEDAEAAAGPSPGGTESPE